MVYAPGNINPSSDLPAGRLLKNGREVTDAPGAVLAKKSAPLNPAGTLSIASGICSNRQPARTVMVHGQLAVRVRLSGDPASPLLPVLAGRAACCAACCAVSGGKNKFCPIDSVLLFRQLPTMIASTVVCPFEVMAKPNSVSSGWTLYCTQPPGGTQPLIVGAISGGNVAMIGSGLLEGETLMTVGSGEAVMLVAVDGAATVA